MVSGRWSPPLVVVVAVSLPSPSCACLHGRGGGACLLLCCCVAFWRVPLWFTCTLGWLVVVFPLVVLSLVRGVCGLCWPCRTDDTVGLRQRSTTQATFNQGAWPADSSDPRVCYECETRWHRLDLSPDQLTNHWSLILVHCSVYPVLPVSGHGCMQPCV